MKIAVAGGTGVAGRHTVTALRSAGHTPIVLARSTGTNLLTGAGLPEAITGVDAIIDATNVKSTTRRASTTFFETTARTLTQAAAAAGVRHIVALSIIGIDRVPYGYYQGKLRQEQVLREESEVPVSILRAAQFHEFATQYLATMRGPLVLVPRWLAQPVAAKEVALIHILDPDVVLVSDGGGLVRSARKPVYGPDHVARFLLGVLAKEQPGDKITRVLVNGAPGFAVYQQGKPQNSARPAPD